MSGQHDYTFLHRMHSSQLAVSIIKNLFSFVVDNSTVTTTGRGDVTLNEAYTILEKQHNKWVH